MAQIIFTGERPKASAWDYLVPGLAQAASLGFAAKKQHDEEKRLEEERKRQREMEDWRYQTERERRDEEKEDRTAELQSKTHEIQKALATEQADEDIRESFDRAGRVNQLLGEAFTRPAEIKVPGAVDFEGNPVEGTEQTWEVPGVQTQEAFDALTKDTPGGEDFIKQLQGDVTIPGVDRYGVETETQSRPEFTMDRLRSLEAEAAKEAEKEKGVLITRENWATLPEGIQGLYPPGSVMPHETARALLKDASGGGGTLRQAYDSQSGRKVFVSDAEIAAGGGRYQPMSAAPGQEKPDKENQYLEGADWGVVDSAWEDWAAGKRDTDSTDGPRLTEEERQQFLMSLPTKIKYPAMAVANLDLDPAKAGRGVEMRSAIIQTAQILNPNFSQHGFEFKRDWAKGKPAVARRAVNDTIADVGRAFALSENFRRTGMPWINKGYVWFLENTGSPEEKALRTRLKTLATEFSKAQNNGQAAKQEEIAEAYSRYSTISTPEELEAILREDLYSTVNRIVTLENDYERFVGEPVPTPTLNKQTIEAAKEAGYYDIFEEAGAVLTGSREGGGGGGTTVAPGLPPNPEDGEEYKRADGKTLKFNAETGNWEIQ